MRLKMRRTSTLDKDRFSMDVRKHFFTVRAVDGWNELPDKVRSAKSIDSFKDAYDKWMRERAESNKLNLRAYSGKKISNRRFEYRN